MDLQRALTKAVSVSLMLQPPVITTAVQLLDILCEAEANATQWHMRVGPEQLKRKFITFDDTFAKYAELLTHRSSGALLQPLARHQAAASLH